MQAIMEGKMLAKVGKVYKWTSMNLNGEAYNAMIVCEAHLDCEFVCARTLTTPYTKLSFCCV